MTSLLSEKKRVAALLATLSYSLGEKLETITPGAFWQPLPGMNGAQVFHVPQVNQTLLTYPLGNLVFIPAGCEVCNVSVTWQVSVFTLIGRVLRNGLEHSRFTSCVIPAGQRYTFRALEDTYTLAVYDYDASTAPEPGLP